MEKKTLTIGLVSGPYTREAPTTAMRIAAKALEKGYGVNMWTYEDAVVITDRGQRQHPEPNTPVTAGKEEHSVVGEYAEALLKRGIHEPKLDWVACVLCLMERGLHEHQLPGVTIGTFADFWRFAAESHRTLLITPR